MAQPFEFALGRTFSSVERAGTQNFTPDYESDISESALDDEISFAARANVPILVTADTLATASLVAGAIQKRQEPRRLPVAVLDCAIVGVGGSLVELLDTPMGCIVLEDIGSLDSQTQAQVLSFLETRSCTHSAGGDKRTQIISTALTHLYGCVKAEKFSEILFYRLNTIHINVSRQATSRYPDAVHLAYPRHLNNTGVEPDGVTE
jgi:transcriptional regulator of aromatic amino acid metabolism